MTWPQTFEHKLLAWNKLRDQARDLPQESALDLINRWWWAAPWCAMSLCWQDQDKWPDPWELLCRDRFCDLARALGISYTVMMLPWVDTDDSGLADVAGRDVVSISGKRYILNWGPDIVIDMDTSHRDPSRYVLLSQLKSRLN